MFRGDRPRRVPVDCGIFDSDGVKEHPSCSDALLSPASEPFKAVPHGRMGKREVFVHDSSFSPENNEIVLDPAEPVASFFTVVQSPTRPAPLVTLHAVASSEAEDDRLQSTVSGSASLREVLAKLEKLPHPAFQKLHRKLLNFVNI